MRKILLIQLRQLGDILLSTPCIEAVRKDERSRGDVEITFLCHSMGSKILNGNPYLDHVITYNENLPLLEQIRVLRHLAEQKFDEVFDFMGNPRSGIMSFVTLSKQRYGFVSKRRYFYNKVVSRPSTPEYIVREKYRLLDAAGYYPKGDYPLYMPTTKEDREFAAAFFGNLDLPNGSKKKILLSPTHRRPKRRWPIESYAKLADLLSEKHDATVLWIWGPGEEEYIDMARALCSKPGIKTPKTTLGQLTEILKLCDFFVGNSNGPSHLAVAAGTPSLQLHGHTNGLSWCPNNEIHRFIQAQDFGKVPFPDMTKIPVDQVLKQVEAQLNLTN